MICYNDSIAKVRLLHDSTTDDWLLQYILIIDLALVSWVCVTVIQGFVISATFAAPRHISTCITTLPLAHSKQLSIYTCVN